jgi:inositol phosphorylceramide mannosyltransferase catalytic subunit
MIPRIFHQIWVGGPLPDTFARWAAGWRKLHPAWDYYLWGDAEPVTGLINQDLYDRAEEFCPGFEGQLRSDIMRLEILHRFGGVYLDTDFECLRPIDPLLEDVRSFACWEIQDQVINNAVLGAEPGDLFISYLIHTLAGSVQTGKGRRPSKISGPHFITARWRASEAPTRPWIYPEGYFYPYRCNELHRASEEFPEAYAVHHWNNQRRLRNKPL